MGPFTSEVLSLFSGGSGNQGVEDINMLIHVYPPFTARAGVQQAFVLWKVGWGWGRRVREKCG